MFSNAKQSIPALFREIMTNDDRRAEIKAQRVVPSCDLAEYRQLRRERQDFRQAAMKALQRSNDPNQRSF